MLRGFIVIATLLAAVNARAFCGFYVGKADTKLFNKASQVVIARDGDKTVMTISSDYQGDMKEFAFVVPVPTVLEKDQIHIGERALIEHLDAYSAPRLVEYFDPNPCMPDPVMMNSAGMAPMARAKKSSMGADSAAALGVKIEAQYDIGEYTILILSAKESTGLETWLKQNGYKIPNGAAPILASYLNQNMKFFVAKVNMKEQAKTGLTYLRPIQMAYESPKFMLPVRLGTVNANGPQEIFVYTLTPKGRVETTNYRTIKLPTGSEVPEYVKNEFPDFYKAVFSEQVRRENASGVFLEYAWNTGWCDPCAAEPPKPDELKKLGAFWLNGDGSTPPPGGVSPLVRQKFIVRGRPIGQGQVFLTRLHARYTASSFPEDLMFQETADQENFQARYVLRHPFTGEATCEAAKTYSTALVTRHEEEAKTLATLTGWSIGDIRKKMSLKGEPPKGDKWYRKIWE